MAQDNPAKQQLPNETTLAIQQLVEGLLAQAPKTPLEMSGLSKEAQLVLTSPGTPKRFRVVPGKSEETGATFDLVVVESKAHPNGRVTQLLNYRHPAGLYSYQSNGGRVPDGFPMFNTSSVPNIPEGQDVPRHLLTPKYLQWRWETFWQTDLRRLNGKELKAHYCADEKGLQTPWQAGKVYVPDDAA